jgi:DNA-binding HxlR family transcriptional regulator
MKKKTDNGMSADCRQFIQGVRDTQEILNGKWKSSVMGALYKHHTLRFTDLLRNIEGIAAKTLSKELKDLEINHLIKRTVRDTSPVTVEYSLTSHGQSLRSVIIAMSEWAADTAMRYTQE